jgi:hypothetical protein
MTCESHTINRLGTKWLPDLGTLEFAKEKLQGLGAEGGTQSNTLFLAVLQGLFNFLRKPQLFRLRTHRTIRTLGTWLYLSCS